ncbi:MAG: TIR domain-containing protein [Saprospiraceae bacterium]|nr:TIR domain-containing protein [Saprospiraceae bacterium]MBK8371332.1 TIR domain-containing protein [Saprospiraceae bacterium]MBK8545818.1 TIR domain-containing protein [Saprospiraceae bacterium]MBK9045115.1 TIR domain-containing protein [Saprospiraceae bacterium]
MANRTGNYCAFYVKTPFKETNLGAHTAKDFVYYNMLRAWKGKDSTFPFVDSHDKNYNVRDDSDWETTLKPRLRDRLNKSKNIILFLSSDTVSSRALREEIDFGINSNGLPVIVIYPEYSEKSDIVNCESGTIKKKIKDLWDNLPIFRDSMKNVPTIHIPLSKTLIESALKDKDYMVATKAVPGRHFYKC